LKVRFADAVKIVNDRVTVELSQNQVDALVNFTFNGNAGGIQVLAPTLNVGDLAAMPDLI
jgi:GH24 family phage-related lysozyme (muramidase)